MVYRFIVSPFFAAAEKWFCAAVFLNLQKQKET